MVAEEGQAGADLAVPARPAAAERGRRRRRDAANVQALLEREHDHVGVRREQRLRGPGRVVASETEVPNILADLV